MANWKTILKTPRAGRKFPGDYNKQPWRPGYLPPLPTPPVLERLTKDLLDSRVLVEEMRRSAIGQFRTHQGQWKKLPEMSEAKMEEYKESIEARKEANEAWYAAAQAESKAMAARLDAYRVFNSTVTSGAYRAAREAMRVAEEAAATTHKVAMRLDKKAHDLERGAFWAADNRRFMAVKAKREADADKAKKKADADKAAVVAWWAADEEKVSPHRSSVGPPPEHSLFGPESDEEKVSPHRSSVGRPPRYGLFEDDPDDEVNGGRRKRKTRRHKAKKSKNIHRKKSKGTRKKRRTRKGRR